jgi:ABC-type transport system involved in multi-copper enzyme maturation permease subunit
MNIGFLCWTLGLVVEVAIMANLAMFFSMILSSTVASFASTFGFYVLSRMTGAIFGTIDAGDENMVISALEKLMEVISIILPRFDLTMQSNWLLYGIENNLESFGYNFVVGLLFLIFINLASVIDLKRKEF